MDKSLVNVQPKGKLRNDKNQNNVKTGTGMSDLKENSLDSLCYSTRFSMGMDAKCLDSSRLR